MKNNCFLFAFFVTLFFPLYSISQSCTNWLKLSTQPSYFRVGDLDITGDKITVEASFIRTAPWSGSDLFQGDLVSKHEDPSDCNYLLRPSSAEITTTNGYYKTPIICPIELNKTYHAAMVYDGRTLKFYRNGYLMSQIAATGNLVQNNWQTQIGLYFNQLTQEQFIGYINEVRIWNVARTQNEIRTYMNQSLPNPQTISGLLAYYTFDNLLNKQGNGTWDGITGGGATINQTNSNCSFIADSCEIQSIKVLPGFTTPDTVCVNTPVNITNTSTGASSYYWNFCTADVNTPPTGVNMGNVGSVLRTPVYIDYVYENGNYYGFLTNNVPGKLFRLNFGSSLLNTPTVDDLGTVGGVIPNNTEGLQIVKNEGKWYVLIVGGDPAGGTSSAIVKVELGADITNTSPIGTYWGNIGNLAYPHDLYVFEDNGHWYGFTVNTSNSTLTRFDFTTSFSNTPTAVNLGNIGNLSSPTGVYAQKDNGNWHVFVTNATSSSLTRLDFGPSLLNAPTGINLGNIGGLLHTCWDIYMMNYCNQKIGFIINAETNDLIKLDFGASISNTPTALSFGNVGNLNFPHCLSKIFRVGADLYTFIANVNNSSLSRLKFTGCTNASIPSSTAQNPPSIIYNTPGVYNINLSVDDGLPTQSSYCKQVVVLAPPAHSPTKNLLICKGGNVKIGSSVKSASYIWSTGATTESITITSVGTYWVESSRYGCSVRDSFVVTFTSLPPIDFGFQQNICSPKTVQFTSNLSTANAFQWYFGDGQTSSNNQAPTINYADYGTYNVKLTVQYNDGCADSLMKPVTIENVVDKNFVLNTDTSICIGDSILLKTTDSVLNYCWKTSGGSTPASLNAYVKPTTTTTYVLSGAAVGKNLVNNGDFSSGNSGFTSGYSFVAANTIEGQYGVGNSPGTWNRSLGNCGDHTTGNGNMMLVNGSPQANAKVWSQTISVIPNTNYTFATWIESLISTNPASLQFSINGVNLGNNISADNSACRWNLFTATWNSATNTTAVISIVNNNTVADGNDFALDDIFFGTVTTKTDSFTVNVTGLCDSIKIDGPDKVCSKADTVTYSIYRSPNCTQPYSIDVDNAFADIVSQTAGALKLAFKQNGSIPIKISSNNGCKIVIDSITVAVTFSPTEIDLGPDVTTCRDTLLNLNAPTGFESYKWQDGSTAPTFIVNNAGTYTVEAQNLCGNKFKDSFSLVKTIPAPFQASPLNAVACKGDSVQFNAQGGMLYAWQPATEFDNAGLASPKAAINASQNFSVQIFDPFCGRDTLIVIPVTAKQRADVSIQKMNDVNCQLDSTQLIASGGIQYTWTPNLFITRSANNQITVKPPQTITYYVEGKDASGCVGQDSVTVYFNKEGEQKLYVPNAFTPNNDGLNDVFRPVFTGPATKFDFKIFNRWGQLIFQTHTPNEGWNGMYRGTAQPKDVYVYYITAKGDCNGTFERKGTFVLIR